MLNREFIYAQFYWFRISVYINNADHGTSLNKPFQLSGDKNLRRKYANRAYTLCSQAFLRPTII